VRAGHPQTSIEVWVIRSYVLEQNAFVPWRPSPTVFP
jgi:hypothetical protein